MKILIATNNDIKLISMKNILSSLIKDVELFSLKDANIKIEIEETEDTLLGNAALKAKSIYDFLGKDDIYNYIIAEDFGFFVDAYPEVAGVYAKRWFNGTNRDRAEEIIKLFKKSKEQNKTARFICATAAISKNGKLYTYIGELKGTIGTRVPKEDGFGYDQIVKLDDNKYLSDYSEEEKNKVSARRRSLEGLVLQF
ncbi:MAG: non-canonical purine NTP pyrophosphatase [Clostridia bacterium]|nr:non-canonical purine NTP pyrophosphatase [Clostridia bacterium]